MSADLQAAAIRGLKAMWRKRFEEAEQQGAILAAATVMVAGWSDVLDRLVTLRAEMREIGRALSWAEDGAPWCMTTMALELEHGALVTAQGETT